MGKNCVVCGNSLKDQAMRKQCPCCGTKTRKRMLSNCYIKRRRKAWLKNACQWFDKSKKPLKWNLISQLRGTDINIDEFINIKKLDIIMRNLGKSDFSYDIKDKQPYDHRLIICSIDDKWEVFYTERGNKYQLETFTNEAEACLFFFQSYFY